MPKKTTKKTPSAKPEVIDVDGEIARQAEDRGAELHGQFPTEATQDRRNGSNTSEPREIGSEGMEGGTPPAAKQVEGELLGDVVVSPGGGGTSVVLPLACARDGESRKDCWERIRKEGRAAGLSRHQAYVRATEETDRLFAAGADQDGEDDSPGPASIPVAPAPIQDDQGVSGLSELPPGWPELPANAQLQVEIAWVTANRLRVRDGTGVNLSKALSPAPSYSALSWLETSILFPAKFADISVKATADQDSEKEFIKREKMAIEEIRSILAEMLAED